MSVATAHLRYAALIQGDQSIRMNLSLCLIEPWMQILLWWWRVQGSMFELSDPKKTNYNSTVRKPNCLELLRCTLPWWASVGRHAIETTSRSCKYKNKNKFWLNDKKNVVFVWMYIHSSTAIVWIACDLFRIKTASILHLIRNTHSIIWQVLASLLFLKLNCSYCHPLRLFKHLNNATFFFFSRRA